MKRATKQLLSNYLIELSIVIIGITIAFWLNNVATNGQAQKEKIAYLTDIKNDLRTDSLRLASSSRNNIQKSEKLIKALELIQASAPVDSVLVYVIEIGNYDFFTPDNFTLTSLLQSGDFKLIDSEETKRELLRLLKLYEVIDNMQRNFLQALDDNYFPMLLTKVDMIAFKAVDPAFLFGIEIKNYCAYTLNETSQQLETYRRAQKQVNKVMELIDAELVK